MSFLKFAFSQKKISAQNLVKALIYQQKHSPSLLDCLVSHPEVTENQVLDIVLYAQESNTDLKTARDKLNNIDSSVFEQSLRRLSVQQIPIGKVCVDLDLMSVSEYEKLLVDYQAYLEERRGAQKVIEPEAKIAAVEPEISAAALESLKELGIMDVSLEASSGTGLNNNDAIASEPEISEAALESMRELGILDESLMSGEKKSL